MIQNYPLYKFFNISTTSAGVLVVAGSGKLHGVTVNTVVASQVITIYDGTSTAGNLICKITCPTTTFAPNNIYEVKYATGLYMITTTGAADITVSYL